MKSDNIKVCKIQVRKVAQDILMFMLFESEIIANKPIPQLSFIPEITAELMNNLCDLVWIESSRNSLTWESFLEIHFERMTQAPYLFANYFAYASYILIEESKNVHECFFIVLALAIHFVFFCCYKKKEEFLNCSIDLFCAFFDKELCQKFEDQGRWKSFNEYIKNQGNLKSYEEPISTSQPWNEIFREITPIESIISNKPFVINNVVLMDITEDEVESHKKAISFADSVRDKIEEVCNKEFEEVLKDFSKTENQVEELCKKLAGKASSGVVNGEDQSFSQEDSLQNVPSKDNPKKDRDQSKKVKRLEELYQKPVGIASGDMASGGYQSPSKDKELENIPYNTNTEKIENQIKKCEASGAFDISVTDNLKSRYPSPTLQELNLGPKLKIKMARELLEEIMKDIPKIFELIKFLCEDNTVKGPVKIVDTQL